MKILDAAIASGYKLSGPQTNLVNKLSDMGLTAWDSPQDMAVNPVTGYWKMVDPFMAALINWTFKVYASHDPMAGDPMTYNGHKVSVQTWDRVRHLILSLSPDLYRDFID